LWPNNPRGNGISDTDKQKKIVVGIRKMSYFCKIIKEPRINTMIVVNLDVMMAKRKMTLTELSERVGITMANMSILKTGKGRAIRFSTLDAICRILRCQPGDILEYRKG
jgi:putative transcriptional regulator